MGIFFCGTSSTLKNIHNTFYTLHFTLYTTHFKIFTINYKLYTTHSTPHTVHYTLYTIHYTIICWFLNLNTPQPSTYKMHTLFLEYGYVHRLALLRSLVSSHSSGALKVGTWSRITRGSKHGLSEKLKHSDFF